MSPPSLEQPLARAELEAENEGEIAGNARKGGCEHVPYILNPRPAPKLLKPARVVAYIYIYIPSVSNFIALYPRVERDGTFVRRNELEFRMFLNVTSTLLIDARESRSS